MRNPLNTPGFSPICNSCPLLNPNDPVFKKSCGLFMPFLNSLNSFRFSTSEGEVPEEVRDENSLALNKHMRNIMGRLVDVFPDLAESVEIDRETRQMIFQVLDSSTFKDCPLIIKMTEHDDQWYLKVAFSILAEERTRRKSPLTGIVLPVKESLPVSIDPQEFERKLKEGLQTRFPMLGRFIELVDLYGDPERLVEAIQSVPNLFEDIQRAAVAYERAIASTKAHKEENPQLVSEEIQCPGLVFDSILLKMLTGELPWRGIQSVLQEICPQLFLKVS